MTLQYILIAVIVSASVAYAIYRAYKSIQHNRRCKNAGCAGCPFYDKCSKPIKN